MYYILISKSYVYLAVKAKENEFIDNIGCAQHLS